MIKASTIAVGLVIFSWAAFEPAGASAQVGTTGTSSSSAMPPVSMMANPYLNPYMNPYMNPMATQQPMNGQNALMFMYMANSANGGLGSGRLSGTRGGAGAKAKAAEMPNTAHPGGGASKYFNPGPSGGGGAVRYYSQRGRYFQNNGH